MGRREEWSKKKQEVNRKGGERDQIGEEKQNKVGRRRKPVGGDRKMEIKAKDDERTGRDREDG